MTMTETTNVDEYNGWTNRETWAASLHLSNDFGLYEMVNGWANDARREAVDEAERDEFNLYAGQLLTVESATERILAEKVESYFDGLRADVIDGQDENGLSPTKTERMMLLEVGSLWRVDWRELASNWLEGFEFSDDA